jgi:endonuclease III
MKKKIDQIFAILQQNNPSPKTELNYTNDFTLLVAIVLSAQATDVGVNKATENLFKVISTPQDLYDLGIEGLKPYIKTIGLFNSKAKNLIALAKMLLNKPVPENIEELEKLPGVGGKTARVFLNCARQVPVIAVDTHVYRVSKRLGIVSGDNVKKVEIELNKNIPAKWKLHAHHWLILHGRYICKARKPSCNICSVNQCCEYFKVLKIRDFDV